MASNLKYATIANSVTLDPAKQVDCYEASRTLRNDRSTESLGDTKVKPNYHEMGSRKYFPEYQSQPTKIHVPQSGGRWSQPTLPKQQPVGLSRDISRSYSPVETSPHQLRNNFKEK